jgi:hypothetical protein
MPSKSKVGYFHRAHLTRLTRFGKGFLPEKQWDWPAKWLYQKLITG